MFLRPDETITLHLFQISLYGPPWSIHQPLHLCEVECAVHRKVPSSRLSGSGVLLVKLMRPQEALGSAKDQCPDEQAAEQKSDEEHDEQFHTLYYTMRKRSR